MRASTVSFIFGLFINSYGVLFFRIIDRTKKKNIHSSSYIKVVLHVHTTLACQEKNYQFDFWLWTADQFTVVLIGNSVCHSLSYKLSGGKWRCQPSGHLNLETVIFTVPPISAQPSPDTQSWAWLRTYFVLYEAQSPSRLIITVMVKLLTSPKVDFIWDCRATAEPGPRLTSSLLFHAFPTIWEPGTGPGGGGGGGTPIHYIYGYVLPKGVVILKLLI